MDKCEIPDCDDNARAVVPIAGRTYQLCRKCDALIQLAFLNSKWIA